MQTQPHQAMRLLQGKRYIRWALLSLPALSSET